MLPRLVMSCFAAALIMAPAVASALSCAEPTITPALNVGADAGTVPTNAKIRINYLARASAEAAVKKGYCREIKEKDGAVVQGSWDVVASEGARFTVVFSPTAPFKPNTEYTVTDRTGLATSGNTSVDCGATVPDRKKKAVIAKEFTTGSGPLSTKPDLNGTPAIACERETKEVSYWGQGKKDETHYRFKLTGATSSSEAFAGMRIRIKGKSAHIGGTAWQSVHGDCKYDLVTFRLPMDEAERTLEVTAVDIAGNESSPVEVAFNWTDCGDIGSTGDGSTGDGSTGDGSTGDGGKDDKDGCNLGSSTTHGLWVGLVLLLVVRRRSWS